MQTSTDNLMRALSHAPRMIAYIRRWTHFEDVPREELETTLEHSLSAVILAAVMLEIEKKKGQHGEEIDEALVLLAAAIHDIGEGRIGDVAFKIKQRPDLKEPLRKAEIEEAMDLLGGLPYADRLIAAYRVEDQKSTLEGRFFNAIEVVGYMYFAIMMVRDRGHPEFVDVFTRQRDPIEKHAKEFASVEELYAPYREFVEKELARASRAKSLRQRVRDAMAQGDDQDHSRVSLRRLIAYRVRRLAFG